MTVAVSTAFKAAILGPSSFESVFNQGRVLVYSGTKPTSADMPVSGTLLATITANGAAWEPNGSDGGLLFQRTGAWVSKQSGQTWRISVLTAGVAAWFRLVGPAQDDGELSYSAPRIDGVIGNGGAFDFYLVNPVLATGQTYEIQSFNFTFPPVVGA